MELYESINARRSIRRFTTEEIDRTQLERVLGAAAQAPSAKNRQPWRFTVVEGAAKAQMLAAMERGLAREREESAALPGSRALIASALHSLRCMRAAPCVVVVTNPHIGADALPRDAKAHFFELADTQSIGAAVQTLCLAATAEGLGSLWICDIYLAYGELCAWLGEEGQLVAAVALGHPAGAPEARPRLPLEDIVRWRE